MALIDKALAAQEAWEAQLGRKPRLGDGGAAMSLHENLVFAVYGDARMRKRGLLTEEQFENGIIKQARRAKISEDEIQAALDAASKAA